MTASSPTMSTATAIVVIETMLGALQMNDLEVTRTATSYTGSFTVKGSAARITLRLEAETTTFHVEHETLLDDWQSACIAHLAGCFCRSLVSLGFRAAPPLPQPRSWCFLAVVYGPGGSETELPSSEACERHIRAAWAALQSR